MTSLWSMSAWTLLPVMLLSSPQVTIARKEVARIVAAAAMFPVLMLAAAPAIGFVVHRTGSPADGHASVLAETVGQFWREATETPLKVFGSTDTFTYGVPFYLRAHPAVVHLLERPATPEEEALIARDGVALLCPAPSEKKWRPGAPIGAAKVAPNAMLSLPFHLPRFRRGNEALSKLQLPSYFLRMSRPKNASNAAP